MVLHRLSKPFRVLSLIFFCIVIPAALKGHGLKYHEFRPVDHRLGMNASAVNCVIQDNHGMIWLGTDRGLFSFDGYQARRHPAAIPLGSDINGVVYCAVMVDSVHLWLGADNGLMVYNTYTDKYEVSPTGLPSNIRAISRINDRSFWIGSINGLYRYDVISGQTEKINSSSLPHDAIYAILRFDEHTYYFGTYNGLCRVDTRSGVFERIEPQSSYLPSNRLVLSLLADYSRNCIWVGVEGGLLSLDLSTQKAKSHALLNGNSVKSLLLDNQNCLWAGTDNGLFIYKPATGEYRHIRHDALNDRSLVNNVVWSVFADREKNIWIGTDAGASLYINNDHFRLQSVSELTGSNEGNHIISLLSDSKGNLWLGGTNGLIRVDKSSGKCVWYQQNSKQFPIPHSKVRSIFEDADGDIWIATDGSICMYNKSNGQFNRFSVEDITHLRNANWSYAISQDETRKLWIATCLGGLFIVDKNRLLASRGTTCIAETNYYHNEGANGLSGNMMQFIAMDADRNMWAGTYRAGVNKIDRINQTVSQFTSKSPKSPLPADDVTAMVVDTDNFLWIALRDRIVRMDTRKHTVTLLTDARLNDTYIHAMADDGKRIWLSMSTGLFFIEKATLKINQLNLAGNYFSSIYYDRLSKRVFAGGINEFVEFDPESVSTKDQQNNLYVTSLSINDRPLQDQSVEFLPDQSIRFSKKLILPHHFNNLTFTFSELIYNHQNIQYAYILGGMDNDWHYCARGNNQLTFNNLPPDEYTLLISRVGSDGSPLPDPLRMLIIINQPWYLTWFAKSIYFIFLLLLVAAFVNYYRILNRLRVERIEKAKTMELTAHKIDFLTSISHELKTPLSLIVGPLEKIIEKAKPAGLKNELSEVRQNALKMGSLIHQMMEASRQEFDGFGLIVSKMDMVPFLKSIVSVYEKQLSDRNIKIKFENSFTSFFIEADVLKLEIIFNNLLSNASRFAPEGSAITVKLEAMPDQVKLSVIDEGPGIDALDLPHVMERYYQSRHKLAQNAGGSGLGLAIVREYIQLHHGTATVISDGSHGTCVEIILPVKQLVGEKNTLSDEQSLNVIQTGKKPLLLIVEDNVEILAFLSKSLSGDFRCLTAQNGKLGLEEAANRQPDVIVTDIMMPVMDGIEMCRRLKENITTSLIPVIMLTARDDRQTELQAYRSGADAFISKPFEIGYLSDRLHHLLRGHYQRVQKARQEAILQPKEHEILSTDEKFLATITQIIENEITNPELNVNILSEKSGYSLKQLYRRIKSLTGHTAVDYIRSVRLSKGALLLLQKRFTVAEVMYMVGFTNHSYFSKRFHEKYGKSPRQYSGEEVTTGNQA